MCYISHSHFSFQSCGLYNLYTNRAYHMSPSRLASGLGKLEHKLLKNYKLNPNGISRLHIICSSWIILGCARVNIYRDLFLVTVIFVNTGDKGTHTIECTPSASYFQSKNMCSPSAIFLHSGGKLEPSSLWSTDFSHATIRDINFIFVL